MRKEETAPGRTRWRALLRCWGASARTIVAPFPRLFLLPAAVAIGALLFASLVPTRAQDSSNGSVADRAAIRRLFAEFDRSFSRHDARGMAMVFSPDADFTNMAGVHHRGRAGIEHWMAPLFRDRLRESSRTDAVRSIRFLSPDLAAVDADTVITGTRAPDGSLIPPRKGLMITVLRRQNGRWFISIFHEAEYPRAQPRPAK